MTALAVLDISSNSQSTGNEPSAPSAHGARPLGIGVFPRTVAPELCVRKTILRPHLPTLSARRPRRTCAALDASGTGTPMTRKRFSGSHAFTNRLSRITAAVVSKSYERARGPRPAPARACGGCSRRACPLVRRVVVFVGDAPGLRERPARLRRLLRRARPRVVPRDGADDRPVRLKPRPDAQGRDDPTAPCRYLRSSPPRRPRVTMLTSDRPRGRFWHRTPEGHRATSGSTPSRSRSYGRSCSRSGATTSPRDGIAR